MARTHVVFVAGSKKAPKVVPFTPEEEAAADEAERSKPEARTTLDAALKRIAALEAVLIDKAVLTKDEIDTSADTISVDRAERAK